MVKLRFTHRPTLIARQSYPERDRQVLLNGKPIGRVLFDDIGPPGSHHWVWSTITTAYDGAYGALCLADGWAWGALSC